MNINNEVGKKGWKKESNKIEKEKQFKGKREGTEMKIKFIYAIVSKYINSSNALYKYFHLISYFADSDCYYKIFNDNVSL